MQTCRLNPAQGAHRLHRQAAPFQQAGRAGHVVHLERGQPLALARLLKALADLMTRVIVAGRNDLERHVGETEPGAVGAFARFQIGLTTEEPTIGVNCRLKVANSDGDVVQAGDQRKSLTSAM